MESSSKKTILISILSVIISIFFVEIIMSNDSNMYGIYFNNEVVGYYDNKSEAKAVCASVVSDLSDRMEDINVDKGDFKYKKLESNGEISTLNEVRDNILGALNYEARLVNLKIKDKSYGTIVNEEEGKKILQKVGEIYVKSSNIPRENILAIDIRSNIKYENITTSIGTLETIDSVADRIIKNNKESGLVEVDIKCREERVEDIEPDVNIVKDKEMYIGESKELSGELGSKEVLADVTYRNGKKINENIINEKVIKESKPSIIYKGSKNPINDGIAFLEHPTRGGSVTSNFGQRWGRNHNGLDIARNTGDPVYSAFDGIVKECQYESGYGNKILIQHENNIQTIYGHLSAFKVKVGDEVKKGDIIGKVGSTGRSTGPHLHFEVRVNGAPVNPIDYIEAN